MLEALRNIDGLDVDIGLEILLGKRPVYLRLLRRYAREQRANLIRLDAAAAAGDREATRYLAHSLKSASGSLGVVGVQAPAFALERAVKENRSQEEVRQLSDALGTALGRVTEELLAALPDEETKTDNSRIDWVAVRRILNRLAPLLAGADTRANEVLEDRALVLEAALGPLGSDLVRHVERFEYPEAEDLLRQACATHAELTELDDLQDRP